MKVLIVVDMQNDFVYGSLGSKQAESIVKGIADYASSFEGEVVYTRDTHTSSYMTTEEGKNLPVIRKKEETELSEYLAYAKRNGIDTVWYLKEGEDGILSCRNGASGPEMTAVLWTEGDFS